MMGAWGYVRSKKRAEPFCISFYPAPTAASVRARVCRAVLAEAVPTLLEVVLDVYRDGAALAAAASGAESSRSGAMSAGGDAGSDAGSAFDETASVMSRSFSSFCGNL
jgi:hypothetical protein